MRVSKDREFVQNVFADMNEMGIIVVSIGDLCMVVFLFRGHSIVGSRVCDWRLDLYFRLVFLLFPVFRLDS